MFRGRAQSLCRQYKKSVGGQREVRVCSCQRANTCLQNFNQHQATATAQTLPAQIKAFPACVKGGSEPATTVPHISPCLQCWFQQGQLWGVTGTHRNLTLPPSPSLWEAMVFCGLEQQNASSHPSALPLGVVRTSEAQEHLSLLLGRAVLGGRWKDLRQVRVVLKGQLRWRRAGGGAGTRAGDNRTRTGRGREM